jgi:hypothetical protein
MDLLGDLGKGFAMTFSIIARRLLDFFLAAIGSLGFGVAAVEEIAALDRYKLIR